MGWSRPFIKFVFYTAYAWIGVGYILYLFVLFLFFFDILFVLFQWIGEPWKCFSPYFLISCFYQILVLLFSMILTIWNYSYSAYIHIYIYIYIYIFLWTRPWIRIPISFRGFLFLPLINMIWLTCGPIKIKDLLMFHRNSHLLQTFLC